VSETVLTDLTWVDVVSSGSTILECSGLMPLLKHKVVGWGRELGRKRERVLLQS